MIGRRGNIVLVDFPYSQSLILRVMGSLSANAMQQIDGCLKAVLGIPKTIRSDTNQPLQLDAGNCGFIIVSRKTTGLTGQTYFAKPYSP